MKRSLLPIPSAVAIALVSRQTAGTAASGTATTVGHAAQGVGRTAVTAGASVAEGDRNKATVGTVKTAGQGTANIAVGTGLSHLKTTSGVLKHTGKKASVE